MTTIETDFSQSFLPPNASIERRLDTVVNRRALMVYAANVLPELNPEDAAEIGLPVDGHERFLDQQRERYLLAAIVRQAHDGKQPAELLPTAWIPKADAGWERAAVDVHGMRDFKDALLEDEAVQSSTYEDVINLRVLQNIDFDPSAEPEPEATGPIHIDDMPADEMAEAYLQGALYMPGLDRSREVNVKNLVRVLNYYDDAVLLEPAVA